MSENDERVKNYWKISGINYTESNDISHFIVAQNFVNSTCLKYVFIY